MDIGFYIFFTPILKQILLKCETYNLLLNAKHFIEIHRSYV